MRKIINRNIYERSGSNCFSIKLNWQHDPLSYHKWAFPTKNQDLFLWNSPVWHYEQAGRCCVLKSKNSPLKWWRANWQSLSQILPICIWRDHEVWIAFSIDGMIWNNLGFDQTNLIRGWQQPFLQMKWGITKLHHDLWQVLPACKLHQKKWTPFRL